MQPAGCFRAVEIHFIGIGNHAELEKIEMGVAALQRIVGPSHLVDAHGQGSLSLRLLQARAYVEMTIGVEHG